MAHFGNHFLPSMAHCDMPFFELNLIWQQQYSMGIDLEENVALHVGMGM